MSNINNIEELYELINPEFLTTVDSCIDMINKAYINKCILEDYCKKVQQRIKDLYKNDGSNK